MKDLFLFIDLFWDHAAHSHHSAVFIFHVLLASIIILFVAKKATSSMQLVPRGSQNIMEAYLMGVVSMGKDVMGTEELSKKYLPLVATIGLFVLINNLVGIIPGFEAATSSLNLTLSLALIVFFYYNFEGIRVNGVIKYFAHFMGPVPILAPLMFPIEIISHLSRIVSLSFRLFGNIKGDDLFLAVVLALAPWIAPLPAYALLTFSALLQAFIFMILTYVYLAGAVIISEEH